MTRLPLFALSLACASSAMAGTVFSDSTFNLADYAQIIWNPEGVAIAVNQTPTGGNPDSAAQFLYSWTGATDFDSRIGLINSSWAYEPSTEGAIAGVDFSMDRYVGLIGTSGGPISNGGEILLQQSGKEYVAFVPAAGTVGSYINISTTGLHSADFGLVSFTTGVLDFSQTPDFSASGPSIVFGLATRTAWSDTVSGTIDLRHDNLVITVDGAVSTPEPRPALMMAIACAGLAVLRRNRYTQNR